MDKSNSRELVCDDVQSGTYFVKARSLPYSQ